MSDLLEYVYGKNADAHRVCKVAYTLNNEQPVLCTLIGDQPLFYMEYEDDLLDEEDDDFFTLSSDPLNRELHALKQEIDFLERQTHQHAYTMQRYEEFSENTILETCALSESLQDTKIAQLRKIISKSRTGAAYLARADEHSIKIMISDETEIAFYDRRSGRIILNANGSLEDQVLVLARELRRHWQHREGVLINPLTFLPEHAILVNRAQSADLIVSVIRVAWELQLAGEHQFWARIENSPFADLGRAYAREAFMDFRTINNGVANAAVLEAWFLSERCRHYDKKIIQAMLADYKGYVFENTEASRSVTAELLAGLGSMPFGKNYLAVHANTIMTDPIFTDVRDRSNANFLWFIKFERSFKETEQELQKGGDLSTHDIRHGVFSPKSQSPVHDPKQTAEVIQLFRHTSVEELPTGRKSIAKSRKSKSSKRGDRGAQIIDLRAWSSSK
jgi:hypothetical protein